MIGDTPPRTLTHANQNRLPRVQGQVINAGRYRRLRYYMPIVQKRGADPRTRQETGAARGGQFSIRPPS